MTAEKGDWLHNRLYLSALRSARLAFGEGLRPRRNGRPKVSRDIGDLRSGAVARSETGHNVGNRPQRCG